MVPSDATATDSSGFERVQQLLLALDRTLRSQRLYAANNPILIRHQQDLLSHFTRYLLDRDELKLQIEPFRMLLGDEPVYRNDQQQDSLAFRLFSDGVRSLTFRSGLDTQELAQFLTALGASGSEKDSNSDAVTRLWEREFEHIEYSIADTIIDEPLVDEKSSDEKVEELVDPAMTMYSGSGGDPEEDLYQDLKITLNLASVGKLFQDNSVLTREELKRIQTDLQESDNPERLVLDFVDMVLAVLQEERDLTDFTQTVEVLGTVLDNNLLQGQLHIACLVMKQVHAFPSVPIKMTEKDPTILPKILKALWPQNRIDLFLSALNQDPHGAPEDIENLTALIDPTIMPYLLKHLPVIADSNRRKIVCQGIARLHKGDLGMFLPLLSSKDPEILRSAIFILSALKNEKVIDLLPQLLQNPNLTIRKEAISILRNFRTPKAGRLLLSLLTEATSELRILALRVLSMFEDKDIARQLMAIINRKEFQERPLEERKAYFLAIAKNAKDDFVPYLQNLLGTKSWFKRPELEDQYQCATYALGVIASPTARKVLTDAAKSGNKTVKRMSENALRLLGEASTQDHA